MADEIEFLLKEMKERGIDGAVLRVDGILVSSTFAISEATLGLIAAVSNTSDALAKKMSDQQRQIQLSFGDSLFVMIPFKNHIFCGITRNPDDKKVILEYAERAKSLVQ